MLHFVWKLIDSKVQFTQLGATCLAIQVKALGFDKLIPLHGVKRMDGHANKSFFCWLQPYATQRRGMAKNQLICFKKTKETAYNDIVFYSSTL